MATGYTNKHGEVWIEPLRKVTGVRVDIDLKMLGNCIEEMGFLDMEEKPALWTLYQTFVAGRRSAENAREREALLP